MPKPTLKECMLLYGDKIKKKKTKRSAGPYAKCIGSKLKGKMSGKTKAERKKLFKEAAAACKGKQKKESE